MSSELDDMDYPADLQPDDQDGEELDITFDDAPPQVKPTIAVKAPKAPRAPKAVVSPKPKRTRKPKVAKAATATVKSKHRVQTVDSNKLEAYLDNLVNVEGYTLISVTGSSSIMGAFSVVSVKVG